jgi:hypothetical protein
MQIMRWAVLVVRIGEEIHLYRVLVGNLKKSLLERSRLRWEDNIEMNLKGIGGVVNELI